MSTPTERGITRMILGIVGANLALDLVRAKWDGSPKMKEVGEGTGLYIFKPSRGGGQALIRVDGNTASIKKAQARPKQMKRIRAELSLLFPG